MKWIAVSPGMPGDIRTEDDTYTPISGEVEFDHNPSNAELFSAFPTVRQAAIDAGIAGVNADLETACENIPMFRLVEHTQQRQETDSLGVFWLQNFCANSGINTLFDQRAALIALTY